MKRFYLMIFAIVTLAGMLAAMAPAVSLAAQCVLSVILIINRND